jgi:hypothetical protein
VQIGFSVLIDNDFLILVAVDGLKIVDIFSLTCSQHVPGCIEDPKIRFQGPIFPEESEPRGNLSADQHGRKRHCQSENIVGHRPHDSYYKLSTSGFLKPSHQLSIIDRGVNKCIHIPRFKVIQ